MEPIGMKSSIGSFALRFAATVVLFAPDGFARDPNSVSLCPPSFRMTERDGCQQSNGPKSGSFPANVREDTTEQLWKEIVILVNNTPSTIQACVWRGALRNGWSLEGARAEISRCEHEINIERLIKNASAKVQACVWRENSIATMRTVTEDEAKAEVSRCQREINVEKLITNASHEVQSCMWRGNGILNRRSATEGETEAEISRCQREITIAMSAFFAPRLVAGVLLVGVAIGFRAKIAAGLYNLFVGCLALRLRFNRARKRFLENANKEAENRLG
jgi:hypothetical protein